MILLFALCSLRRFLVRSGQAGLWCLYNNSRSERGTEAAPSEISGPTGGVISLWDKCVTSQDGKLQGLMRLAKCKL